MEEESRGFNDLERLAAYPIFRDMTADQVGNAAAIIRLKRVPTGQVIWREGDEGDSVFLLLEGDVDITQKLTLFTSDDEIESRDKSLIHLKASDRPVIGEIALCANTPRSATVTARTDTVLGCFSTSDLRGVIDKDPRFGYLLYRNIASIIAERLIHANRNVLKLTTAFSLALQRGT